MDAKVKWALHEFFNAQKGLSQMGVIRSRDYVGDVGRYLSQAIYDLEPEDAKHLIRFNNCPASTPVRLAKGAEFDQLLVVLGPNSWLRPQGVRAEFVFYRFSRPQVLEQFETVEGRLVGGRAVFEREPDRLLSLSPEPEAEVGPEAAVSLRPVTAETLRAVCRLSDTLTPPKKYMVAPNAVSIAQAHFAEQAWFRAVYADDTPVGFIMLYDDPEEPAYFLWRFMIAEPHHGKGFGRRALELLIEHVRTRPGAAELRTSCGQGAGSPQGFYQKLGFEPTGDMVGDEVELRLAFE